MGEDKKKKKRELKQHVVLKEEEKESQTLLELVEVLESLEKEGKLVDIQVCPVCKSPKIRRVGTMRGDLWGHMGIIHPKFECQECGWEARLTLEATNRPLGIKDVAIIAEASDSDET